MSNSTAIRTALVAFLGSVNASINEMSAVLEAEWAKEKAAGRPTFRRSDAPDPKRDALVKAARAIFAAEAEFCRTALTALVDAADTASVIDARTAADAILRMAASAFSLARGNEFTTDYTVEKLLKLRDAIGTGNAGSSGGAHPLERALSPRMSPRMGPLG